MTRRLVRAGALFLVVQHRSGFLAVYALTTLSTVGVVRWLLPSQWHEVVVPVLLLMEYGAVGVFLTGAQTYLARIEGSTEALAVTPLRAAERTVALVLTSALVATVAAAVFVAGVLGLRAQLLLLLPPLLGTTVLAGAVGLVAASRHREFTRFILGVVPVIAIFSLPLLSLFELAPRYTFAWLPWDAALYSFVEAIGSAPRPLPYGLLTAQTLVCAGLGLRWAVHREALA